MASRAVAAIGAHRLAGTRIDAGKSGGGEDVVRCVAVGGVDHREFHHRIEVMCGVRREAHAVNDELEFSGRHDFRDDVCSDDLQIAVIDRRRRSMAGRALRIVGNDARAVIRAGRKIDIVMARAAGLHGRYGLEVDGFGQRRVRLDVAGHTVARVLRVQAPC